jgi:hypothetical protein
LESSRREDPDAAYFFGLILLIRLGGKFTLLPNVFAVFNPKIGVFYQVVVECFSMENNQLQRSFWLKSMTEFLFRP